jgi:hypothetical protein
MAEEAGILSRDGGDRSRGRRGGAARRYFFVAAQALSDVASVRGVGLSLLGLAAA